MWVDEIIPDNVVLFDLNCVTIHKAAPQRQSIGFLIM